MNKWIVTFCVIFLTLNYSPLARGEKDELESIEQKYSYGYGVELGRSLKRNGLKFDASLLIQGFKAASKEGSFGSPKTSFAPRSSPCRQS